MQLRSFWFCCLVDNTYISVNWITINHNYLHAYCIILISACNGTTKNSAVNDHKLASCETFLWRTGMWVTAGFRVPISLIFPQTMTWQLCKMTNIKNTSCDWSTKLFLEKALCILLGNRYCRSQTRKRHFCFYLDTCNPVWLAVSKMQN